LDVPGKSIKKALIALVLSVFFPGVGQAYNRMPYQGAICALLAPFLVLVAALTRILHGFRGLAVFLVAGICVNFTIHANAIWNGYRDRRSSASAHPPAWVYAPVLLLAALNLAMGMRSPILPGGIIADDVLGIRAFRMTGNSMEPTVSAGEQLMVDVKSFRSRPPQRGDLVVFLMPPDGTPWVKRVIAIGGDLIEWSPEKVVVNGTALSEPYLLLRSPGEKDIRIPHDSGGPLRVPAGQFFLMGDNRLYSYDSRHVGTFRAESIRGKPLYIYWTPSPERIGSRFQ
jgi:signal peptidase I